MHEDLAMSDVSTLNFDNTDSRTELWKREICEANLATFARSQKLSSYNFCVKILMLYFTVVYKIRKEINNYNFVGL